MEFLFNDPNTERLTPAETRLLNLCAELDSNKKHLRIVLCLTPFQEKPDIELKLTDSTGTEIASTSIIEPVEWNLELILHIRKIVASPGKCTLAASLSYPDLGEVDRRTLILEIPDS